MTEIGVRQRGDRAVFGVVFLMFFAFSYSEQVVSGLFPVVGGGQTAWRVAVVVVDAIGQPRRLRPLQDRCLAAHGVDQRLGPGRSGGQRQASDGSNHRQAGSHHGADQPPPAPELRGWGRESGGGSEELAEGQIPSLGMHRHPVSDGVALEAIPKPGDH